MSLTASVIINTYNRADTLAATLDAFAWQRHPRFEVIVVNGPSTDRTDAVLARYAGRIRIGQCPEANLSMSRNIGLGMAAGDIVAYIDDDAIPEPDWLEALMPAYADPTVGTVGGFIRDHTGFAYQCKVVACDRYGDNQGFATVAQALAAGVADRGQGARRFLSPTGCNSSFRRSALESIGGFDETFAYFLDETDVVLRLLDAGWTAAYAPEAEVHHRYAPSHLRDPDRLPRSIYQPARSKAYFAMRHAAPLLGLPAAFGYLARYRTDRRRDKHWLLQNGLIDQDRHDRLVEEINRGTADGVADAFRSPSAHAARFPAREVALHAFPVLRPAAERLRLCFLSQEYPPGPVGGIAVWTRTLATELAARGHEVTVVSRGEGQPRVDFEEGVWVHRIPPTSQFGRMTPALPDLPPSIAEWALTAFDEVQRIRARRGLDLVSAPIWDVEGIACAAAGTLPVVTSLHSTYKLVLPSKRKWNEDATYRRLHVDKVIAAERWLLDHSSAILANSQAILRAIEDSYEMALPMQRVVLVPHGLQPPAAGPDRREAEGCRILFVGRFELRKGIDLLVDAVPEVLRGAPDARFVFVGDTEVVEDGRGPVHREALEALPPDLRARIEILGVASPEALEAEYRRADIFVAPSRFESFGLVFLEAMMHGAACIGTDAGGIPEVVADGETGLLVPPGDAAALAGALLRLARDKALRARLGEAGRQRFLARFTAAHMAEAVETAYAGLAARRTACTGSAANDATADIIDPKLTEEAAMRSLFGARNPGADGPLALRQVAAPRGVYLGRNRVLTQTNRGVRLILDTRDIILTPIVLLQGEWEPETSRVLLDLLRPGMNFVDVGANMGYFTCLAGLALRGGGKVWAFEPDPATYELLVDNVSLNWLFENMHLERKGVYSRSTTLTLYKREKYVGNTSLGAVDAKDLDHIVDAQTPMQVDVVSLDEYFLPTGQRLDLVKIDVEGAEPHVIEGMAGLVRAQPHLRIIMEWSPGQIASVMKLDVNPMLSSLQQWGFSAAFVGEALEPVAFDNFSRLPHGMILFERAA